MCYLVKNAIRNRCSIRRTNFLSVWSFYKYEKVDSLEIIFKLTKFRTINIENSFINQDAAAAVFGPDQDITRKIIITSSFDYILNRY